MSNIERFGISIDKKLVGLMDNAMERNGSISRSEFIADAIEFYIAAMNSRATSKILTPALESVINANIKETENHLARVIFKQSVEISMLMHIMAMCYDIDKSVIDDVRDIAAQEVSKINGKYKFEDIIRFEESREKKSDS